ncbi:MULTISPECIES: aspartate carbamoyltransferase regulatory subunit [Oscillospiraceae]|uniref:Aspartate carbamoyltransferase regulatory subunit n=1 Tax=Harryflintia acetispora TaxID=1849041 RepID=A0A9X8Y8W8_9FIRM|nr:MULTISPECIES: aspartate carbamoyltransferase regulatory subunit [Oscillospiraceae]RGB69736.1 aspartate carbamoyltransferase regulatory subunit [Harryflintia acetispora]TCL44564.1 aspartate carbamoyltransferase regulatory subunit [Harryflintia acetispora]
MLNVDSLQKGVVIDHIKAGSSMDIYHYLRLDELDCSVAIIKNAKSAKMGRKDIIKIEELTDINLDVLGFIDNNITVNIIESGRIVEKKKLTLPEQVRGVIRCKNPRCITAVETDVEHIFRLADRERHLYRCIYCEQEFDR